ncbi:MAG: SurA N-terminal domain-containing protein [Deltaproteobacteria bacterium]|nr:SurA N-terminal domain-containing protein [Deltaproteobacteria bacterium]
MTLMPLFSRPAAPLLLAAAAILCAAAPLAAAPKIDRIVAQVNRDVITLSELEARIAVMSPAQKAALTAGGGSVQSMVLNMMIEEELLNQAAAQYDIRVSEAEIDEAVKSILEENHINESQLKSSLSQGGMSYPAFRLQLRRDILTNKLVSSTVVNRMVVTENEVTDFLNGNLPPGVEPLMSASGVSDYDGVRMIYLTCDPRTAESVMRKAAAIKSEIESGSVTFEEAARKYSQGPGAAEGGNPGNITVRELQPELQAIARDLAPGKVSQPLYAGQVVLLVSVVPTMAPSPTPKKGEGGESVKEFTPEQRQTARRSLEQMKVRGKMESYLADLKKKAVIKITL